MMSSAVPNTACSIYSPKAGKNRLISRFFLFIRHLLLFLSVRVTLPLFIPAGSEYKTPVGDDIHDQFRIAAALNYLPAFLRGDSDGSRECGSCLAGGYNVIAFDIGFRNPESGSFVYVFPVFGCGGTFFLENTALYGILISLIFKYDDEYCRNQQERLFL